MFRWIALGTLVWHSLQGEVRHLSFSEAEPGTLPVGFRSTVSGEGQPGVWKIIEDEPAPTLAPSGTAPSAVVQRRVLAHLGAHLADEHFPLLILENESFTDFKLTTRFKTVSGTVEQMAGIAFRIQDERNYYVVRASSLGNTFRFYKFVDGTRTAPVGPPIAIPRQTWHELTVECKGSEILCFLNGQQVLPTLTDTSFSEGRIGFWSKSDSVTYFGDTSIEFTPRVTLAVKLVREAMDKHSRLLGIRIYSTTDARKELHVVAATEAADLGKPGSQYEHDVVARGVAYYGKEKGEAIVSLPLRDRNGEAVAAVRITLKAILGQTEQNAVARAKPIVREMESRVRTLKDLTQ